MDEGLSLLTAHLRVCIAEDEANRSEEITLARSIATDDDIEFGGKWVDDGLVLVAARLWLTNRSKCEAVSD